MYFEKWKINVAFLPKNVCSVSIKSLKFGGIGAL